MTANSVGAALVMAQDLAQPDEATRFISLSLLERWTG